MRLMSKITKNRLILVILHIHEVLRCITSYCSQHQNICRFEPYIALHRTGTSFLMNEKMRNLFPY